MKKKFFLGLFLVLAVLCGLMFSGCEEIEDGIGTIKLANNSSVRITYWCAERGGKKVGESHTAIYPGASATAKVDTGFYTIYLEDVDGDGWVTKTTCTVKKDETVEVKFPGDFKVSN